MNKFRLYYKETDPKTGKVLKIKNIALFEGEEKSILWIKNSLCENSFIPNMDFYCEKIVDIKVRKNKNYIELLNSEGPVLMAQKDDKGLFTIIDENKNPIFVLNENEMQDFIHENLTIWYSKKKNWKYSEYPGSMKPNLKILDEFIGIDTEGKTY